MPTAPNNPSSRLTPRKGLEARTEHVTAKVAASVKRRLEAERNALGLSMAEYLANLIDQRHTATQHAQEPSHHV